MILNAFFLAFRQIRRNIIRSVLTMLGIIIGVAAVIVMINLGNGANATIKSQMESLGSNVLMVFPTQALSVSGTARRREFSPGEVEILRSIGTQYVSHIAPLIHRFVLLQNREKNTQTDGFGVDSEYFGVTNWAMSEGRHFTDDEYAAGSNVCILGATARKNLFGEAGDAGGANASNGGASNGGASASSASRGGANGGVKANSSNSGAKADSPNNNNASPQNTAPSVDSPIGARIKINKISCEVVGVLTSKGQGVMGNQDDVVLMPMKAFQRGVSRKNSIYYINRIFMSAKDGLAPGAAVSGVREMMQTIRPTKSGTSDSFEIFDTKEIAQMVGATTGTLTLFLSAVAGVSLLVGGIGIMNIMLVSVTERTKEIGTRLAIGALQHEVLLQFLIESLVVSTLGGLIGIFLAIFGTWGLSAAMNLPFVFDLKIALIAFVFSALIGIAFGYLPARRASRLNPIDALRHE